MPGSECGAVNVSVRLRRAPVALLMAVLLITPILDCTLHRADQHTHPTGAVAALAVGSSHTGHLHGMGGHPGGHCAQHMIHCVEKAALPSGGTTVPLLPWAALIGMATVIASALVFPGTRGIRGPPGTGSPVSNGQTILTEFCISRR